MYSVAFLVYISMIFYNKGKLKTNINEFIIGNNIIDMSNNLIGSFDYAGYYTNFSYANNTNANYNGPNPNKIDVSTIKAYQFNSSNSTRG